MEVDSVTIQDIHVKSVEVVKAKKVDKKGLRKIFVPRSRQSALKEHWLKIFTPIVEQLFLQMRYNVTSKQVEIRLGPETQDPSNLQKGADFVRAFILGFAVEDALALLRLDDLFIESFEVNDVKMLKGDHLSRAIGRLAGKGGRTKFTLENSTKTRIVLQDSKIHILGNYKNIQYAKRAISHLILGSPASKVYGNLRSVANKMSDRL
ncbi:RNA-binding protein pno1 [Toxorhynchites rutilus septentrionalis]|uniref:RNA-binding protein pno1 n=1 Tax=Toxorhynchites rutilus septentrionalis TaxID=329112 RepID=UPI002479B889|nr:RNA-binding protein pno1 [Toxorhynchites rutilus septentrionalis]